METSKIRFKYVFQDDYNPSYVNGAYGGVGPRGEIVANFYIERQPIPKSQDIEIHEGGFIGDSLGTVPEDLKATAVRYVQCGVVMNLETAQRMVDWLQEHINTAKQIQEQNE